MDKLDLIIIKGINSGNEASYILLFKEYYKPLYRFASNYIMDYDIAHDIVQDFFVDIFEKGVHIKSSLRSYMYTSIKNRCLNFLRSLKIKDEHKENIIEAHIQSNSLNEYEETYLVKELDNILSEMPKKMKTIFNLRVVEDMKFKEISNKLNITENNAKVQMHKAISFIKERLKSSDNKTLISLFVFLTQDYR